MLEDKWAIEGANITIQICNKQCESKIREGVSRNYYLIIKIFYQCECKLEGSG